MYPQIPQIPQAKSKALRAKGKEQSAKGKEPSPSLRFALSALLLSA
jgi:hypothetical protein